VRTCGPARLNHASSSRWHRPLFALGKRGQDVGEGAGLVALLLSAQNVLCRKSVVAAVIAVIAFILMTKVRVQAIFI
jgi:hypothetical protein